MRSASRAVHYRGLTGLFLAAIGLTCNVTDTYFIIAHFHYIMVGGTIMGTSSAALLVAEDHRQVVSGKLVEAVGCLIFIGFN